MLEQFPQISPFTNGTLPTDKEALRVLLPPPLNPQDLALLYAKEGLVRRIVQTMVDDALVGGLEVQIHQHVQKIPSSVNENSFIQQWMQHWNIIDVLRKVFYYIRLYGGGAILLDTGDPLHQPLNPTPLSHALENIHFIPLTRYEINLPKGIHPNQLSEGTYHAQDVFRHPIKVYGNTIHPSRLIVLLGDMPPPEIRHLFQGWGISVIDAVDTAMRPYFQLFVDTMDFLDQAKLDIYKIKNYGSMASQKMKHIVDRRITDMNARKNIFGAIILDVEDSYEQKIMDSSSLIQFFPEIRMRISMACGIPMSRLFGLLNKGFSTGEDDLEIYNQTVESQIRSKMTRALQVLVPLLNKILLGDPNIFSLKFQPLRVLSPTMQNDLLNATTKRLLDLFHAGLISKDALLLECHHHGVLNFLPKEQTPQPVNTKPASLQKPEPQHISKESLGTGKKSPLSSKKNPTDTTDPTRKSPSGNISSGRHSHWAKHIPFLWNN